MVISVYIAKYNDHQHSNNTLLCEIFYSSNFYYKKEVCGVISCDETTLYMPVLLVQVPLFVTLFCVSQYVFDKNDSRAQKSSILPYQYHYNHISDIDINKICAN